MNIEQAKTVQLSLILDKLNFKPAKQRNHELWYLSPFRDERTASFKLDTGKNLWYDFGEGTGGDIVAFACVFLERTNEAATVADALRWLNNLSGTSPDIRSFTVEQQAEDNRSLIIKDVKTIKHRLLINYLERRGIPLSLAQTHLKELRVYNRKTKKSFFTLGFANEESGYELRNPFFKGCIGEKHISFIRGNTAKPDGLQIFEGSMDFLSALAHHEIRNFDDDAIVLNTLSCLQTATPYIKNYGYRIAYTWMDNDKAGQKASLALAEFFKTEDSLHHKPMNRLYAPHKDVNAWHMH